MISRKGRNGVTTGKKLNDGMVGDLFVVAAHDSLMDNYFGEGESMGDY